LPSSAIFFFGVTITGNVKVREIDTQKLSQQEVLKNKNILVIV